MRLIDYYNYAAAILLTGIILFCCLRSRRNASALPQAAPSPRIPGSGLSVPARCRIFLIAGVLFILAGFFLRLYAQAGVPAGMHQDEANIGYEAYILSKYGVDRDLHPWPVYPITYGSGGGSPLLIYLNVLTTKLFGSSITVLRRTCSVFGCLTILLFVLISLQLRPAGKENDDEERLQRSRTFCFAALVFSILPWHIILSRWSLDSNTTPFWELLALALLLSAVRKRSTAMYCLSSAVFALCLYSYGSANLVVPLFLLIILPVCMYHRELTLRQLILSGLVFIVVLLPLIAFYAVNYLGLPEILTPYFSVNRFTSNRLGNVFIFSGPAFFSRFKENLVVLFRNLTTGYTDDSFENFLPSFATLFRFTFPLTLTGLILCVRRTFSPASGSATSPKTVLLALFFASAVFSLLILPRINRFVLMYAPMACFIVIALDYISDHSRYLAAAACCLLLGGGILFAKDYFYRYNTTDAEWLGFMPGYSEAVIYAESLTDNGLSGGSIYHTRENVNTLYLIAMYALKTDPYEYQDSVVYLPEWDEFRHTKEFGNLKFYLPPEVEAGSFDPEDYSNDLFIVNNYETWMFDPEFYTYTIFDRYAVVSPAEKE